MVYTKYLSSCPSAGIVQQAEAQAKQLQTGVWGDASFTRINILASGSSPFNSFTKFNGLELLVNRRDLLARRQVVRYLTFS